MIPAFKNSLLILLLAPALAGQSLQINGGVSASGGVSFSSGGLLIGISVSPASPQTAIGVITNFTAIGTFSNPPAPDYTQDITSSCTWTTSAPTVASLGTLSTVMPVTALAAGTSNIACTFGGLSSYSTLTVKAAGTPTLTSIAVNPSTYTAPNGNTVQYTALGTYSDGSTGDVTQTSTWASSSPAVAAILAGQSLQSTSTNWSLCYFPPGVTTCNLPGTHVSQTFGASSVLSLNGPAFADGLYIYKITGSANNSATNFHSNFQTTLDANGGTAQAFEFDMFQFSGGTEYMFGSQCLTGGFWQVWDQLHGAWVNTSLSCSLSTLTLHTIGWDVHRSGANMVYDTLTIDGTANAINMSEPSGPTSFGDAVGIQFQMDEGSSGTALSETLQNVSFGVLTTSQPVTCGSPGSGTTNITAAKAGITSPNASLTCNPPPGQTGPPTYYGSRSDLNAAPNPAVPPQVGPNTCTAGSLNTCGNLTGANTIITDPDFSNRMVRVTDSNSGCGGACTVSNSGASGAQVWNADATMFTVGTSPAGGNILFSFNTSTLQATKITNLPGSNGIGGFIWAWGNRNILYAVQTTKILKYDLTGYTGGAFPAPSTVFDFSIGACLGADPLWNANRTVTWHGQFQSTKDDQNFAYPISNAGAQGTGFFTVVYTVGSGCRVLDSKSGIVYGQWGTTGSINISDRWLNHANAIAKGSDSGGVVWDMAGFASCLSGTCGGTTSGYFWNIATTTLGTPATSLSGHESGAYSHRINNCQCNHLGQIAIRTFAAPGTSSLLIPLGSFPSGMTGTFDQHFSWQNVDSSDNNPVLSTSWTGNSNTPFAWANEVLGQYTNTTFFPTGTTKRFAHTFNTNQSQYFSTNIALGAVSPDGKYELLSSDWLATLGNINGTASCTIGTNCRGDVFVVELK